MKFWAYKHQTGSIHVKKVMTDSEFTQSVISDAHDSPFVDSVMDIYEAKDRDDAEKKARIHFGLES